MGSDRVDLLIQALATSKLTLLDRLADVTAQRDAYRRVAQQTLHCYHDLHVELTRLRKAQGRLLSELRDVRALPVVRHKEVA